MYCTNCDYKTEKADAIGPKKDGKVDPFVKASPEDIELAEKLALNAESHLLTANSLVKNQGFLGTFGVGKPILSYLDDGEQPHYLIEGNSVDVEGGGDSSSLFGDDRSRKMATGASQVVTVVTDQRVFVIVPQMTGNDVRNIPYDSITGVDLDTGLVNKRLTIQTHGRTYHMSGFFSQRREVSNAMEYIRKARNNPQRIEPPPETTQDPISAIERLNDLKEAGVISTEEFEAKKSDLLDEI